MTAQLKVVDLSNKVEKDTLQIAEELLAQVKSGHVRALGYAAVLNDGAVQTAFSNKDVNAFTVLGAFERLKQRYANVVIDEI